MQLSSIVRNVVLTSALVLGTSHLALAQSADEIVKRSNALYTGAKTFQATMVMDMSMGALGSMSATTEIKSVGNQKMSTKTTSNGKATGQVAMGAAGLNMQIVDDGKTMYTYMPAMNKYSKRPHVAGANPMASMLPLMGGQGAAKAAYKMLPATTVGGKPVYAIEATGPQSLPGMSIVLYVDKATLHIKQMKMKMAQPNPAATGAQGKSLNMTMTMSFQNEIFNAPIPDSTFKFTPPPGATEMQGFPGMPGGAGGMSPLGGR
jgi:outer membrane lipoprotein-sorting protein